MQNKIQNRMLQMQNKRTKSIILIENSFFSNNKKSIAEKFEADNINDSSSFCSSALSSFLLRFAVRLLGV